MEDPNKLFRAKLDGKSVVKVLLSSGSRATAQSSTPVTSSRSVSEGTVRAKNRPDDFIVPVKRGTVFNFYDMGENYNGSSWVNTDLSTNGTGSQMTATEWGIHNDILLDFTDRVNTFRKITSERVPKYGILVGYNGDTPALITSFGATGHEAPNVVSEVKLQFVGPTSHGVDTNHSDWKVTNSPTYGSSPVSLNLKGKVNVFLVPVVGKALGATTRLGTPGHSVSNTTFFASAPRSLLDVSGASAEDSVFSVPVMSLPQTPTMVNTLLDAIDSWPIAEWFDVEAGGGTITPVGGPQHMDATWYLGEAGLQLLQNGAMQRTAGTLCLIIENGSNTYYVWNTVEEPTLTTTDVVVYADATW